MFLNYNCVVHTYNLILIVVVIMKDIQGIDRGRCSKCPDVCAEYTTGGGSVRCLCGHAPADHEAVGTGTQSKRPRSSRNASSSVSPITDGASASYELCPFPGCNQPVEFDPNTGEQGERCSAHRDAQLPLLAVATSFAQNGLSGIGNDICPRVRRG